MVDEDTGLYNRGKGNRPSKPARNGHLGNQRGKPEESSKVVDENTTTDKKTDSPLAGKPSGSVTNPNVKSDSKEPSSGISELSGIFTDGVTSEGSNVRTGVTDETPNLAFPESHLMISGLSGEAFPQSWRSVISDHKAERITKLAGKDDSRWRTIESRDGHLVQGLDGKMYRLLRGPTGLMGPPGEDVSPSFIFSLLFPVLLLSFIYLSLFDFFLWLNFKILSQLNA